MTDRQPRLDHHLRVREVADDLRKHPKTILRWIETGELPAFKVGRQWLVSERDLRKFLIERWHG